MSKSSSKIPRIATRPGRGGSDEIRVEELEQRRRDLVRFEQNKRRADFLATAEEILALAPDDVETRARVVDYFEAEAEAFANFGLIDKSIELLREAVAWDPTNIAIRELLVAIYERADRKEDAARELLALVSHSSESAEACEAYLWRAVALTQVPKEIFTAARELGFDLFKRGTSSLDEEPTNVTDDEEASSEAARRREVITAHRPGTALFRLLTSLESIEEASLVELYVAEEKRAEFSVQQGMLVFGVRIDGALFVDDERCDEDAALRESLDACGAYDGEQWLELLAPLARRSGTRKVLRRITARGLLSLARLLDGDAFELVATGRGSLPQALSFSAAEILKLCVELDDEENRNGPAATYFDDVAEEAEEGWLIRRHALDQPIPLAEKVVCVLQPRVAQIEHLGLAVGRLIALTQRLQLAPGEDQPRYLVLFTDEGPWCCVIDAHHVALVLTRASTFGTLFHRAQAQVDSNTDGEDPIPSS